MIGHLTAHLALLMHLIRAARDRQTPSGHDVADLSRQIHGRTASELAAAQRRTEHTWQRIETELVGDADFRRIAAPLLDQISKHQKESE